MSTLIYILNGPNLNLLGQREPHLYGRETLADIEAACHRLAQELALTVVFLQSNAEHQLIDWIHQARIEAAGIIINPAAYSHTSIALLDALKMYEGPVVEVHISNIYRREAFRHHSYVSQAATGVIGGCGSHGYLLALRHLAHLLPGG